MSRTKRALETTARQRLTPLHAWVATSGCWTVSALVVPHSALVVLASTGLALLLGHSSVVLSRKPGRERWAHMPTLVGLLAAAGATNYAMFTSTPIGSELTGEIELKAWITGGFVGLFVLEQTWPFAASWLRKVMKVQVKHLRRLLKEIVKEVLREERHVTE
ncbi:MAG: hypothetical protein LC808_05280 [Actinobacteria bacterium]|nr:hypothetical protein [Actinomycetota bacterium]